ncbi:Ppx/GppA family phosphatase [Campylobacter sp. FMV-PI01]|uniref:Ppx/GppA family phosphatase n=1 Tax=Campylobacter portucalensis TaxID=2608384 RepID=A0A6L5WI68_9BACT|nr:Ppx/GppA phosphatase family protein [Campylobacter portucalensis]MSN96162.1 Ppx/GppA family phosphatase [Campylobacter portucalensis]
MARRVAVIDLGSNSLRMAIFERTSRLGFYILGEFKIKVRLAKGAYQNDGSITKESMDECFEGLREFKKIIKNYKATKILAVGTSALRDAPNSKTFINLVKKIGINLRVIDGDKEAYYGGFAALNLLNLKTSATTIDIGGGSTEFARIQDQKIVETISINLGTVRLKEMFFDSGDFSGLDEFIARLISEIPSRFKNENLIVIGGSLRAISNAIMSELKYPLETVHAFSYKYDKFSRFIDKISTAKISELDKFYIKKDRFDTIRAGANIFKKAVDFLNSKNIITSGVGVREGVFLTNLLGLNRKFPANFNPSLKSLKDRFEIENRTNIAKFAKSLFEILAPIHNIDKKYETELITASKLVNIGLKTSFYSKHKHSAYLVLNSLNFGYTHEQKVLISSIIYIHGKKNFSQYDKFKSLLPQLSDIIWLSFIVELARILDEADICGVRFEFSNQTLKIYGLKDEIYVKNSVKKLNKPDIFAITFN